jgi:hypothetical protein
VWRLGVDRAIWVASTGVNGHEALADLAIYQGFFSGGSRI